MSKIQQPVQKIKMTNVAVVQYKAQGKRFQIACYKNKVMNWRNGIEKDLNEVLQSNFIFTNVSKGVTAPNVDLTAVFHTTDVPTIAREILEKGDVQVGEKERALALESSFRHIAQIVVDKNINSETKRPFSIGMIERAMKDELHFSVKPHLTTKQQALQVMKALKAVLPIERAQMRLKLELPLATAKALKAKLMPLLSEVEHEEFMAAHLELIALIDPGAYRSVEELLARDSKGKYVMEIMDLKVQELGEATIEAEEAERESKALGLDKLAPTASSHKLDAEEEAAAEARMDKELASHVRGLTLDDDDDDDTRRGKKQAKKKSKAAVSNTAESDDDQPASKAPKAGKKAKAKKSGKHADSDSDDGEAEVIAPAKKVKKAGKGKKAAAQSDSEDDDGPAAMSMAPKKKQQKQKQKAVAAASKAASESESESDDDAPAKSKKPAAKKSAAVSSSDSSESSSESDDESVPAPARKKPAAAKKQPVVSSSSEDTSSSESDDEAAAPRKAAKPATAPAPVAEKKPAPKPKQRKKRADSDEEEVRVPRMTLSSSSDEEDAKKKPTAAKKQTKAKGKKANDSD